ncbi:hypothetical protein ASG25_20740 [Rhizobium sp. Leaf384]|nr:hypothetical protein ASG25_20740 [Rhizobium sp. Leaf384]
MVSKRETPPVNLKVAMRLVGLVGLEPRAHHDNAHDGLPKKRDPESFAENGLQLEWRASDVLPALAAPKVRVAMSPWIGPGRTMATRTTRS